MINFSGDNVFLSFQVCVSFALHKNRYQEMKKKIFVIQNIEFLGSF